MDIQPLIANLSHPDESERLFAADDLGMENDPAAVAPLVERLYVEPSRAVREMILLALRKIAGDAVLDHAPRLLSSPDAFIRNEIAAVLQSRGEAALLRLREAQQHPDPDVRKLALETACQIGGPGAAEFLERALDDSDPNVVIAAVEQAGTMEAKAFQPRIEAVATGNPAPMLALACIEALSQMGDAGALDTLLDRFGRRDELVYALIGAVGCLGERRHLAYLENHAENPALRQELLNALLKMQSRGRLTQVDPAWLARIERWFMSDSTPTLRQDCLTFLERLAAPPAAALAKQLATRA